MVNGFDMSSVDALDPELRRIVERRASLLGPAYKLFYANPVRFVRAEGVHLFDADGQAYLDAYNNVPSVGHCHPRVGEAIARQAATLNTHTRVPAAGGRSRARRRGPVHRGRGPAWLRPHRRGHVGLPAPRHHARPGRHGQAHGQRHARSPGDMPGISAVRGAGLYVAADFTEPGTGEPDGDAALRVVNGLRERRVLISATGPYGSTLKIRPPLPFAREHVDQLAEALTATLCAL
jgi:4-aminobutyrate aminotransferase-like enzyme